MADPPPESRPPDRASVSTRRNVSSANPAGNLARADGLGHTPLVADPLPELTITPCVHVELGGPGPEAMKLAPRSELILEFMDWCMEQRIYALSGTSGGHAGHHVAVFDAIDYPRIKAWLVDRGYEVGA